MLKLFSRKAQSTAEYAVLVGLVVAAAIGIQVYVKRGWQERVHAAAQQYENDVQNDANWALVNPTPLTPGTQFEPGFLVSKSTQETFYDDANSNMQKEGTLHRDFDRRSRGATNDKQVQRYDVYEEQP